MFNSNALINHGNFSMVPVSVQQSSLQCVEHFLQPISRPMLLQINSFQHISLKAIVKQRTQLNANATLMKHQQSLRQNKTIAKLLPFASTCSTFYPRQHLGGEIWYVVALWRPNKQTTACQLLRSDHLSDVSSDKQFANSEYFWY